MPLMALSPSPIRGYVSKPKWIYVLGLSFLLAPFGNFVWSLAALGVKRWWDPQVWAIWLPFVEWHVWILMAMVSLSGLSLLLVRRWSWLLSIVALVSVFVYSLVLLPSISSKTSIGIVALLMIITVGAMGVVLFSPFRLPYINPRLRWWESDPRYRVEIRAFVGEAEQEALLSDISRSGALVEWGSAAVPEISGVVKLSLPMGLVLAAEVVRKTKQGYALRFLRGSYNKAAEKALTGFLTQLAKDPTKLVRK